MSIRRIARFVARAVAGVTLLTFCLYTALIAINWSDESPSSDALQLERVILGRPAIADEDNAFVSILGLAAPLDQNPFEWGRTRKQFLDDFVPPDTGEDVVPLPGSDVDYKASRSQATAALADACRKGDEACVQLLDPEQVARWLASEKWLLDRYIEMVKLHQWRESILKDVRSPFPPYRHAINAQMLLLMTAWQQARAGDGDSARALLQQDLAFWRMVLRSSDLLITKMIATAAIDRHFALGNLALRELHGAGTPVTPPDLWLTPISPEERSMQRPLAGEWSFVSTSLGPLVDQSEFGSKSTGNRLLRPMMKVQATNNLYASHMLRVASALDVDYRSLPEAQRALAPDPHPEEGPYRAYNPIGHILYRIAAQADYAEYGVRVSDLEGARRAALLAVELRAARSDPTNALRRINSSTLKNPYTDHPFEWDADTRCIVFNGLAPGDRSRHAVLL